jgi:hypothetical protein
MGAFNKYDSKDSTEWNRSYSAAPSRLICCETNNDSGLTHRQTLHLR